MKIGIGPRLPCYFAGFWLAGAGGGLAPAGIGILRLVRGRLLSCAMVVDLVA